MRTEVPGVPYIIMTLFLIWTKLRFWLKCSNWIYFWTQVFKGNVDKTPFCVMLVQSFWRMLFCSCQGRYEILCAFFLLLLFMYFKRVFCFVFLNVSDQPSNMFPVVFSNTLSMEKRFISAPFSNNYKCELYSKCVLFSVKEILEALKWRDQIDKQRGRQLPIGDMFKE